MPVKDKKLTYGRLVWLYLSLYGGSTVGSLILGTAISSLQAFYCLTFFFIAVFLNFIVPDWVYYSSIRVYPIFRTILRFCAYFSGMSTLTSFSQKAMNFSNPINAVVFTYISCTFGGVFFFIGSFFYQLFIYISKDPKESFEYQHNSSEFIHSTWFTWVILTLIFTYKSILMKKKEITMEFEFLYRVFGALLLLTINTFKVASSRNRMRSTVEMAKFLKKMKKKDIEEKEEEVQNQGEEEEEEEEEEEVEVEKKPYSRFKSILASKGNQLSKLRRE
ncbi:hypothetical protein PCE1_004678 [Barthelona sp. PCE]